MDLRVRASAAPSKASGEAGSADEPVVLSSYRDAALAGSYVAVTAAGVRMLVATAGHVVCTTLAGAPGGWAPTPAGSVAWETPSPSWWMCLPTGRGGRPTADAVSAAAASRLVVSVRAPAADTAAGLYSPHTPNGELVVDGLLVPAHTTALPVGLARAAMASVVAASSCAHVSEAVGGGLFAGGAPRLAFALRWVAGE